MGVPRDASYSWRMGRDSLARHKMCRLWGNRDDLPTLSFGKSTCCRTRVLIRPTDPQNKHAPMGRGYFLADGEGFEPPVELPPQRFSRPSQSTALPPILNFFPTVSQPTVLFAYRTWRCCSPLVRTRLRCACLADSYARPSQSTALPPILNFFPTVSQPTVLFAYRTWRCCSPLVRTRLRCACLADSYARPSQSTAALTHPKLFPTVFQPVVLFDVHI